MLTSGGFISHAFLYSPDTPAWGWYAHSEQGFPELISDQ